MTDVRVRPDLLYAWRGPSLLIVDTHGECGSEGLSGFYYREARFIKTLRLRINGHAPWRCDAAAVTPDHLAFTFVHPDVDAPGGGGSGHSDDLEHTDADGVPERALDIRLSYRVRLDRLDIGIVVTNRALRPLSFTLAFEFDADFADIQEAQSGKREERPELPYRTSYRTEGSGWRESVDSLAAFVNLDSQQAFEDTLTVTAHDTHAPWSDKDVRERDDVLRQWQERFARIEAPGRQPIEQTIAANLRDFASFPMMEGQRDEWLTPQAGMPLYPAFFGRDALTAGWQAACVDRGDLLEASMTRLGRMQSARVDAWRDEEPGRLPYQVRQGPLALLDINPYSAYYADFASPLMFVISLANLYAWTGDMSCVDRHWDTARRILDWAREYGDRDRDGYLEYQTRSPKGTKNQGWKDSGDAIIYPDGSPVQSPIATCELQGYWYIAQQLMASLSSLRGRDADATALQQSTALLKERFNRDWWVEEEKFFAMALDPEKRRVPGKTSNVGHCLTCGIIDDEHLPAVVGTLFAPDMFSGWGVRTLSSEHAFYNPLSYHRGTVWAVEQGTIAFGLRRFGFNARALDVARALFDLAALYADYRVPECIGGYARGDGMPGAYPRANTPQLWNASVFALLVQTMAGLLPAAPVESLVVDPDLPEWLPELVIRDLRVGEAKVSLRCWRDDAGKTQWDVLHKQGTLHVVGKWPVTFLRLATPL